MAAPIIDVRHLSKRYRLGGIGATTLRDELDRAWQRFRGRADERRQGDFWALQDVSFSVERGDVLGIIGRNGAGKSTLLKIISRITQQTSGEVTLRGRVASLLEVGTGFHGDLTGSENIYLNGAILGMTRAEIRRKFDEIVAFAEVDRFLETPVKRYSSGMAVRLAFAVAAHLQPEILVVDEVLAVGDVAFQRKCLGKMDDVARSGRTVMFVSHNMTSVRSLCHSAHLLDGGQLVASGPVKDVVTRYLENSSQVEQQDLSRRVDRQGDGRLRFTDFRVKGTREDDDLVAWGEPALIEVAYESTTVLSTVGVSMGVYDAAGEAVLYLSNEMVKQAFTTIPRSGTIVCAFDKMPLLPGSYSVNLYCTANGVLADWVMTAGLLNVSDGDYYGTGRLPPKGYGVTTVPHQWCVS